jgi:hypothetical protein
MAQQFNLPSRTLPLGDTVFGPFTIPVGTREFTMVLDVANMPPPPRPDPPAQQVWILIEWDRGNGWQELSRSNFFGPWFEKQNVLHNDVTLRFTFGGAVAQAGWQARVTFIVEGAAYNTAGGTLTLA